MSDTGRTTEGSSDTQLISAARAGDNDAYGELFSRHRDAALRMARQLVSGADADDLVAEAFARVLAVVQAGKGPYEFFRAYLLSTIRRLHVDRIRASARVRPTDDEAELDRVVRFVDPVEMAFDQKAAAAAFASLPERWQLVLWHLEVERQKPAQIAPLLGMSANSVSALAYRAREGLRLAYLQGHLAPPLDDSCRWTTARLGQHVRKSLSKRDAATVDDHLESCSRCSALYVELSEVNRNLAGLLAPVVLGAAASGYLTSAGAVAGAGIVDRAVDWISKPFRAATSTGPVAGTVVAVVAVGAVAVAQVVTGDDPEASPAVSGTTSAGVPPPSHAPSPADTAQPDPPPRPITSPSVIPTVPTPPTNNPAPPPRDRPSPRPSPSPQPTTTTPPPGPTSTDYGVSAAFVSEGQDLQRRLTVAVSAAGETPRGNVLTLTLTFSSKQTPDGPAAATGITYRGGLTGAWSCGNHAEGAELTVMTCSREQTGTDVPDLALSVQGSYPGVAVDLRADDNDEGPFAASNTAQVRACDWYTPSVCPAF